MPSRLELSQQAINEYLTTNCTVKALSCRLGMHEVTLSKKLKKVGITVKPVRPEPKRDKCESRFFEKIDTEAKAYWLGFIFAEGWLSRERDKRNGRTGLRFGIELGQKDLRHLMRFRRDIGSTATISKRTRKAKTHKGKEIKLCCIRIGNPIFCQSLLSFFPAGPKSSTIKFPTLPHALVRHFIRGYFDGDGCITAEGHLSFTSNSRKMLQQLENIFLARIPGCRKLRKLYRHRKVFKYIKSKLQALPIYELMYNDTDLVLPRKYKRYCQIFGLATS